MSLVALEKVFKKYSEKGKLPKAIIVDHLYGLSTDMNNIVAREVAETLSYSVRFLDYNSPQAVGKQSNWQKYDCSFFVAIGDASKRWRGFKPLGNKSLH